MSILKSYRDILEESQIGDLVLTDIKGYFPVTRGKLVKALYYEIVHNRDKVLAFKGYIISDLLDVYTSEQLDRIEFIGALKSILDNYILVPYKLPKSEVNPILPGNMFNPFMELVKSYNSNSYRFKKVFNNNSIMSLDSFRIFCRLLNSTFHSDGDIANWLSSMDDLDGSADILFTLKTGMSFESNNVTRDIKPHINKMNFF